MNNFVILAATQFNVQVWVVGCFNNKEQADTFMEKFEPKRYNVSKEDVTNLLAIHPRAVPKKFDDILKDHIIYWLVDLNKECESIRYAYGNSDIEWEGFIEDI